MWIISCMPFFDFWRFFYLRSKFRKEKPVLLFIQDLAFTAKSVRKRIYCKPVEILEGMYF